MLKLITREGRSYRYTLGIYQGKKVPNRAYVQNLTLSVRLGTHIMTNVLVTLPARCRELTYIKKTIFKKVLSTTRTFLFQMKQFKIISIRGRREWCALNCFFFSLSFLSMSTFCCQDKCFKKKFIRIICFSYAMPNLNHWQKIYSKTKYKRSKRERVITIGFELVFFVLKREKIYWNITFHLFLKCS